MTTKRIAMSLVKLGADECIDLLTPSWAGDAPVVKAYADVQTLKRQRDELTSIFPKKEREFARQFDLLVMEIAKDLHEQLYEVEA